MWGQTVAGARMACVAEQERFRRGERIALRLLIENVGEAEEYQVLVVNPFLDNDIVVMGPDGKPATLTEEGEALRSSRRDSFERRRIARLKPGEQYLERLSLLDWFDFSMVGEYDVNVSRLDMQGARLSAEPCRFLLI